MIAHQNAVIPYLFRRLAEIQIENSSDPSLGRVEEVYLCDHCDQDFTSLTQLMVSFLFTLWDCGAFQKVFYCNFLFEQRL